MLINGKIVQDKDISSALNELNSSFPDYKEYKYEIVNPKIDEKGQINFDEALSIYQNNKDFYNMEVTHQRIAEMHKTAGSLNEYKLKQKALLDQSKQTPKDERKELQASFALASIAKLEGNIKDSVNYYSDCYKLQQGKVDYQAYNIEQKEVGYSDQEKIGTTNIQQCVVVIVRDPKTNKTALAHVDKFTNPESLGKVMEQFPDTELDVMLVGGRDRNPGEDHITTSDNNIKKIVEKLKEYENINIKSADIAGKKSPSAIVVDPQSGKIENATPGKPDPTLYTRSARLNLTEDQLNYAFDLTKSKEIPQVKFDTSQKQILWHQYVKSVHTKSYAGTLESWKAGVIQKPMIEVMKEIMKEDRDVRKGFVKWLFSSSAVDELHKPMIAEIENFVEKDPDIRKELINSLISKRLEGANYNPSKKAALSIKLEEAISGFDKENQLNNSEIKDIVNQNLDRILYKRDRGAKYFPPVNLWHTLKATAQDKEYMSINENALITFSEAICQKLKDASDIKNPAILSESAEENKQQNKSWVERVSAKRNASLQKNVSSRSVT